MNKSNNTNDQPAVTADKIENSESRDNERASDTARLHHLVGRLSDVYEMWLFDRRCKSNGYTPEVMRQWDEKVCGKKPKDPYDPGSKTLYTYLQRMLQMGSLVLWPLRVVYRLIRSVCVKIECLRLGMNETELREFESHSHRWP